MGNKKRTNRGGYRQPSEPAYVKAAGPGARAGANRTDGGAANVKQPIRRLPDAGYQENKAFVAAQEAVNGLPKAAPTAAQIVKSAGGSKPQVFTGTELPGQDPRAGGATGQSIGVEAIASAQDDVYILLDVLDARNPNNPLIQQLKNTRAVQKYNQI